MEKKCPNCGHEYNPELIGELNGGCPKCMVNLLQDKTALLDPQELEKPSPFVGAPFEPGDTYHGMEIVELLGRGGMGYVYKARQPKLDRLVALKILDPCLAISDEFAERFNREAKALAALSHPNIVQVYDYGHEGDYHFLVMEFIDGANLRNVLLTSRIEPKTALRYVPQMCDALEYAHAEGVIHRDIKPENILIDKRGNLKVADFGLAKICLAGKNERQITVTGQAMGTPNYMAPEQLKSMNTVDHRADIYSLGVVFYEMLTGELPMGHFPAPSKSVEVDVRLDDVVLKALEQDPERRYQRASHVKSDIEDTASSSSANAREPKAAMRREEPLLSATDQADFADILDVVWIGYLISIISLFIPLIDLSICSIIGSAILAFKLIRLPSGHRSLRTAGIFSAVNIFLLIVLSAGSTLSLLMQAGPTAMASLISMIMILPAMAQMACSVAVHWNVMGATGRTLDAAGRADVSKRCYSARIGYVIYTIALFVVLIGTGAVVGIVLQVGFGVNVQRCSWLIGLVGAILVLPITWFFGWLFILRPLSSARAALRDGIGPDVGSTSDSDQETG